MLSSVGLSPFWLVDLLGRVRVGLEGGFWISEDQAAPIPSMSKPSLMIRILPQESQFAGTRILSLSMTLCLRDCGFKVEWMSRDEWTRVCRELARKGVVYINDEPSMKCQYIEGT
jgi:hypothetical protein